MSKTTVRDIAAAYRDGDPITMLTAYDAPIARLVDRSGVDIVLVGDSAGHNHLGYGDTLQVTMAEALSNTAAVVRGTEEALVLADLPFMSYGASIEESVESAGRFLKEAGADGVKLETAPEGGITVDIVDRLTTLGVPVQGHLGLTPQRVKEMGGPVVQGREGADSAFADQVVETACDLEAAGIFSLVIEGTTEGLAKRLTEAVDVPTIGIGAGRYVDGQVLVTNDVIGLDAEGYRLSKQYADVDSVIEGAVSEFVEEVRKGEFPTAEHAYEPIEETDGSIEE
jgi:3-methyl-2-oxobutanoate hydroxymethyltransferase